MLQDLGICTLRGTNRSSSSPTQFTAYYREMKTIMLRLLKPPVGGPAATLLLRLMCGGVFFWEGILKFVYANQGIGRFTKLGIPMPGATADFIAVLEIVGGILLLAGLGTRLI